LVILNQFSNLFKPIKIGKMTVKNRIVFPPMGTRFADVMGQATKMHVEHYRARAKGGAGLLIVPWVLDESKYELKTGRLRLDTDEYIRGLNEIVEAVHEHDAKIAIQLSEGGRAISKSEAKNGPPVAPSVAYCAPYKTTAREMTVEEVEYFVNAFAEASYRAKVAGFDAVEYHAASGYMISQFLSPFVNKRTDKYGGSPGKRMTFLLEIIEKTREKVGPEYPLMVRISGDEFIKGGLTLEDNKYISKELENAGVDCIDVTMGIVESYHKAMPPMCVPRAAYIHLAEGIKQSVDIPVIGVGRINTPELGEKLLEEGKADMIAFGRALLADSELPIKAWNGNVEDITPCIACNRCEMATSDNVHVKCTVNPRVSQEWRFPLVKEYESKDVVVIGGGPAGMSAAANAAKLGHKVTLYEKTDSLGGQLVLAAAPPHKEEIAVLNEYLETQVRKSGVKVLTGEEITPIKISSIKADAVILATGARQIRPRFPGIDDKKVVYSWDVLSGEAVVGDEVVIIGGGMVGLETAELLGMQGKTIRVLEMLPEVGMDMEPFSKIFILERFVELGVEVVTNCRVNGIVDGKVEAMSNDWRQYKYPADTVVIAIGSRANDDLCESLAGLDSDVYVIGDCKDPSKLLEAIHTGTRVAHSL